MTSVFSRIDEACASFARQHELPGLVAGIVQKGVLTHTVTVGLADIEANRAVRPATAFRIASMTKNMTALAILSLRDQGRLALDAPLSQYVPQFARVPAATRDSPPVSVRHLVSHVAGFVTDDPWGDRVLGMSPAELDALMAHGSLFARPPGIAFEYSNLGYALLGRVLTNVTATFQSFIRRTSGTTRYGAPRSILRRRCAATLPGAIGATTAEWSRDRRAGRRGGRNGRLITNVPDYARWVAFLLTPGRRAHPAGSVRRATIPR